MIPLGGVRCRDAEGFVTICYCMPKQKRPLTNKLMAICCFKVNFQLEKGANQIFFILGVKLLTKDHKITCLKTHGQYLNPGVVEGILDGHPFSRKHK